MVKYKTKYRTIIIGAGPAGLRCAKILAEGKEDFILLEAKENIYRKFVRECMDYRIVY